jgi:hypothetical protein
LSDALDYLAELGDTEETLSEATEAAIKEGLDDLRNAGRSRWKNTAGHAVCEIEISGRLANHLLG